MFAVETERQRLNYITYSRDEAFKNIMEYSHWRANPRLVRAIVNESAETIAWLNAVWGRVPAGNNQYARSTPHLPAGKRTGGGDHKGACERRGKEKGVKFELGVSVQRIIKEAGSITGVVVERDGEEIEVASRAVIIASGGYANNKEWIRKYYGLRSQRQYNPYRQRR